MVQGFLLLFHFGCHLNENLSSLFLSQYCSQRRHLALELLIKSEMFELKFAVGDGGNASFPN